MITGQGSLVKRVFIIQKKRERMKVVASEINDGYVVTLAGWRTYSEFMTGRQLLSWLGRFGGKVTELIVSDLNLTANVEETAAHAINGKIGS